MNIQEARAIVTVSNTVSQGCPFFCGESIGGADFFQSGVNHLISTHSCTLLHVGGDTSEGLDGKPWQGTAAVLGSSVPLPEPRPTRFTTTPAPNRVAG